MKTERQGMAGIQMVVSVKPRSVRVQMVGLQMTSVLSCCEAEGWLGVPTHISSFGIRFEPPNAFQKNDS